MATLSDEQVAKYFHRSYQARAPGSLSQNFQPIVLVSGAIMLGVFFGWGAFKTKSLFWASVGHTFSGLIQVIWNVI
jgi:hypothetical protein